jgi:hypothetical protein
MNNIPIISKQKEIEDLRKCLEKTRSQLAKALDLVVMLTAATPLAKTEG